MHEYNGMLTPKTWLSAVVHRRHGAVIKRFLKATGIGLKFKVSCAGCLVLHEPLPYLEIVRMAKASVGWSISLPQQQATLSRPKQDLIGPD